MLGSFTIFSGQLEPVIRCFGSFLMSRDLGNCCVDHGNDSLLDCIILLAFRTPPLASYLKFTVVTALKRRRRRPYGSKLHSFLLKFLAITSSKPAAAQQTGSKSEF